MEALISKVITAIGATLVGGGVFVVFWERLAKPAPKPEKGTDPASWRVPMWAYLLAGICSLLGFTGGFIGAMCGFASAAACVRISRNPALSVPRRLYRCILLAGLSWVAYFALASSFASR
jgi:hypothetical protein